jgi:hypothetical protein
MLYVSVRLLLHGAGVLCPDGQTLTLPKLCCVKAALTSSDPVIVTVQVKLDPVHGAPQPRNSDPAAGVAVSVTCDPPG